MTEPTDTRVRPDLQDLGDYLQGLARVLLERDRQRQAHEAQQAEADRQLRREEAERATRQREAEQQRAERQAEADRQLKREEAERAARQREQDQQQAERQAEAQARQVRDDAQAQLQLLRVRTAHLLDQAPAVCSEFDALLARPDAQDPVRLLPEVRKELDLLPKLLDKLAGLQAGGLPQADQEALLPHGLFQIGVALQGLDTLLRQVPSKGVGRFVKIGADGAHLPAFATQWQAVLDTASGLMWEVKTEGGLHSRHSKYTNHGKAEAGDSGWLVSQSNQQRLAGHADWRLPTKDELVGLAHAQERLEWSPNDYDWYWSSSAAAGEDAWYVDLGDGSARSNGRSLQWAVRVVRAGQ